MYACMQGIHTPDSKLSSIKSHSSAGLIYATLLYILLIGRDPSMIYYSMFYLVWYSNCRRMYLSYLPYPPSKYPTYCYRHPALAMVQSDVMAIDVSDHLYIHVRTRKKSVLMAPTVPMVDANISSIRFCWQ